jgi:ABC-type dipeptide/oligopeptide/nickel transport system permease subunit
LGRAAWRAIRASRLATFSFCVVVLYAAVALYGEGVYRWHQWKDVTPPYQHQDLSVQYQPPSAAHPMGTDNLGRDVMQRLVQGARVAFHVGIVTSMIAIPIGLVLGLIAGYFGGKIDDFVVWLYSTFASIPGLLFILAIAMVVGKGLTGIFLGIGLTTWVSLCRLIRGEVMKHKERPYVLAARALGYSHARIIFRHILPNVFHIVIVSFTLRFPAAIGTEVFMSFLGIGVQGEPSWGIMINNARTRLWQGVWWEMTFVTAAVFMLVLSFNLLGDVLRDALDPRLKTDATTGGRG